MKKFVSLLLAVLMTAALFTGCAKQPQAPDQPQEEAVTIRVGGLKGPTSMGLVKLLDDAENQKTANAIDFRMAASANELNPLFLKGELDIMAVPANLGSDIQPLTISRQGAPHDAAEPDTDFPSASQLRQRFLTGQDISSSLPPTMAEQLELARQRGALPQLELWERAFLARLRTMTETDYAALPDVTEGLEHRLYRASRTAKTTEELLAEAKTKRYTHARLRRVLLAAMLELPAGLSAEEPPYLRVLGFTAKGAEILNRVKGRHTLPLSASLAELEKAGEAAARFAALEARAADLYHAFTPGLAPCGSEYTTPVIKI